MDKNYITVDIEGLNPEKFINLAVINGLTLWNIERLSITNMRFNMNEKDFKRLRHIAKKTNCRAKIIRKNGVIFLFRRLYRRMFFIVGIVLFVLLIYFFSNIIWNIEIYGNKIVSEELIIKSLNKAGLKVGTYKKKVNLRDVENSLLKDIKELSMVTISLDGTKAKVEIVERTMPPTIMDFEKPTNIVAAKDGILTKVIALKGQKLVKEGDFVKKGQILISGVIKDSQNIPIDTTRALGEVYAKTWYESIKEVPLKYRYFERTGKYEKFVYLILPNNKIVNLRSNINKFQFYDKIIEKEQLKLLGIKSPVIKATEYYYEKIEKIKDLSYSEAIEIATKLADEQLMKMLPKDVRILDRKYDKILMKDKVKVRKLILTEEKISKEEDIK
ncbi:MAG: sporulation protein YqfD [Caloramator sp.]|nr:sporulation protein YqfD [Caloramator sp.]